MTRDEYDQPTLLGIDRDVSELLGLAKGMIADGAVSPAEADALRSWVARHADAARHWPVRALVERLAAIYRDGIVDEAEREDLATLLQSLCSGDAQVLEAQDMETSLPLDSPPPQIIWQGSLFVLAGRFAFGTAQACQEAIRTRGGTCESEVTRRTRYVVIGTFGSRNWAHTSFGRKIQRAINYREDGVPLAIVAERHWAQCLTH